MSEAVLAAAALGGVGRVYTVGGAQAVAALHQSEHTFRLADSTRPGE